MFVMTSPNCDAVHMVANFYDDEAGPRIRLHTIDCFDQTGSISIPFHDADYAKRIADAINSVKPNVKEQAA